MRKLAIALSSLLLVCCSTEDALDPIDAGQQLETSTDHGPDSATEDSGGTSFDDYMRRACGRLIGECQGATTPMNQPWNQIFVPWSEATCQAFPDCVAKHAGDGCVDRLVTYFICLAKAETFSCQACLNAYQFVQGVCPCIKECDPSCP